MNALSNCLDALAGASAGSAMLLIAKPRGNPPHLLDYVCDPNPDCRRSKFHSDDARE